MKTLNLKEIGKGYDMQYAATILDYLYFIEGESPIHLILDNFDVIVDDEFMSDVKNVNEYYRTDDIELKLRETKQKPKESDDVHKQYYVYAVDTDNFKYKVYDRASETWIDMELNFKNLWPNIKKFLYSNRFEAKRAQNAMSREVYDTLYNSMDNFNVGIGHITLSDEDLAEIR